MTRFHLRKTTGWFASLGLMVLALCALACHPQPVAGDPAQHAVVPAPTTQPFARFTAPSTQPFAPLRDQADLDNSHVVTAKIISGAQPENDKSFALLRDLGVKTIVSVDGAQPDVESAKRFGM